jgi:uncharacterized protein YgbK (DUF1537 family)
MTSVRAVADDLSGALDTGAAFVGLCGPLPVSWRSESRPQGESYIIDNETRSEADAVVAQERTRRCLAEIAKADCSFKKIDSLMRGHTIAELSACVGSRQFSSVVVAPAFPKQRRVTKDGQQFADFYANGEWTAAGVNLADALRTHLKDGIKVRKLAADEVAGGSGVFVCDATSDIDLTSLPKRAVNIERPILWCGTAGLAYALAEDKAARQILPTGSTLVIIGSNHPVSRRQVEALAEKSPEAVRLLDSCHSSRDVLQFLERRLRDGQVAAIAANFGTTDSDLARRRLNSVFRDVMPCLLRPDLVVTAGGETLLLILDVVGAQSAVVDGEVMPGIARGRVVGGVWDGVIFASKSGAFGTSSVLVELLASRRSGKMS